MFAVIAYINYRKEVSIKVHGYATTEESAREYVKQAISAENKGFDVEPNNEQYECYVWIKDLPNSRVICEFVGVRYSACTDEDCEQFCESIMQDEESLDKSQITVGHVLENYDVQKEEVGAMFDVQEVIGGNFSRFKELLDFLLKNKCGVARENLEHHVCEVTSDVFAVVEMGELPCKKSKLAV